jgi:O-antigen/teichoic acid export membrane protein
MEDADFARIKRKSISGVVVLGTRTFLLQVISFASTFLLTVFLTPAVFGVFYLVSALISFFNYFADIGLAAALIQKKEDLTQEDLASTFTIQQILVGSIVLIALFFSSRIAGYYGLDDDGLWLFRALIISFLLSSLRTIPSILLERKLEFHKLIIPQVLDTLGFYVVAVTLAWRGAGITSFTWAVLVRAVVGLVALYIVSPWRISIGISRTVAKRLMRFGIPFQLIAFIALVKDDLLTIFLGKILPFAEIGYIGWAKKWSEAPLRLVMDNIIRVTFPAFARLQHAKGFLAKAINNTIFGLSAAIFPLMIGLFFFLRPLIEHIPRYSKWEPAIVSFYLFAVTSILAGLSTPLINAFNATGKIRTTLTFMIGWTVATWILSVLFIRMFGFNGYALALLLVSLSLVIVIRIAKQLAPFSFWKNVSSPFFGGLLQSLWYWILVSRTDSAVWLSVIGFTGAILYAGVLWMLERNRIVPLLGAVIPTKWRK